MKKPSVPVLKTSISLDPEILEKGQERAYDNGQSLSSYINLLIRRDLEAEKAKERENKRSAKLAHA
jgi:hypothetical protein